MAASMKRVIFRMSNFPLYLQRIVATQCRQLDSGTRCCHLMSSTTTEETDQKSSLANAFKQASLQQQQVASTAKRSFFRTLESNPVNHTSQHEGLYYTVEEEDYKRYMTGGVHPKYHLVCKAFQERCIMVRRPATEIFQCLRASNFSLPVVRYVVYGRYGTGKSITLSHVMQHCGRQGWLVVHIPWVRLLVNYPKEVQTSPHNSQRGDTPVESLAWLNYFYSMNKHLLQTLTTKNSYTWSKREATEAGVPFSELVEFGFARSKYAGDVMGAVLKEAKQQSNEGLIKTLVAIDGANSLWHPTTIRRLDDRTKKYLPEELNSVYNIRKLVKNDWTGGAVVLVVDSQCAPDDRKETYTPRYILEKEAIDELEPHIPIHVENFNDKEASSCLSYFTDRKWIQRPEGFTEEGKKEILFLSSKNPSEMYHVSSRW